MKFAEAPRTLAPEHIITLPPSAFAEDYEKRPKTDVAIGLRRLSQADTAYARAEAEREAVDFYSEMEGRPRRPAMATLVEVRNDALMCLAVGRACTDPNDATKPWFRGQEDTTRVALTPEGVRRIWDEYVLFCASSGVARAKASDAEAAKLGRAIAQGAVKLDDEARMLLAYLGESLGLDELVDDEILEDVDGSNDGDVAVYVARAAP